jgi:hypothetical protein
VGLRIGKGIEQRVGGWRIGPVGLEVRGKTEESVVRRPLSVVSCKKSITHGAWRMKKIVMRKEGFDFSYYLLNSGF